MVTGIVILNYNNFYDTINCFKSINKYCYDQNLLITIVDNYSKNNSVNKIAAFLDFQNYSYKIILDNNYSNIDSKKNNIFILQSNNNLGYAKGNNLGIKFLINQKVDNILILNNDILFSDNIISPLVDCLDNHPEIGLISPLLMKDDINIEYTCCRNSPTNKSLICEGLEYFKVPGLRKIIDKKYILKTNPNLINKKLIYCDIISGSCIMAKRTTWEKINCFDENTFLFYEENILFEKLKQINLKTALLTTVKSIHLGAKSTKTEVKTEIRKIELRSLLYYLKTYRKKNICFLILIKSIRLLKIYFIFLKYLINNPLAKNQNNKNSL